MKPRLFLLIPLVLLGACTAPSLNFAKMSDVEIVEYNSSVSFSNRVYCSDEVTIGSHIRKRNCVNFRNLFEGWIGTLDTPSSSRSEYW